MDLRAGEIYEIRWEALGVEDVYIELVSGGKSFGTSSPIPAEQGRYDWTVPDMTGWVESEVRRDNFRIFIHNNSVTNDIRDYSDQAFTILSGV